MRLFPVLFLALVFGLLSAVASEAQAATTAPVPGQPCLLLGETSPNVTHDALLVCLSREPDSSRTNCGANGAYCAWKFPGGSAVGTMAGYCVETPPASNRPYVPSVCNAAVAPAQCTGERKCACGEGWSLAVTGSQNEVTWYSCVRN